MKNLIWIVVAGGVVLGGWWLFSGDSPADVARDVSDQVNAPEVLASAGDTVGDAVVVVTDSVSGSLNETAVAADRITDGEPQPQIQSEAENPVAARTMMPADADPVGGAGTTTLTDRAGTLNADVGGDSAAALGEAGGVNAFADNGTASTASVMDSDVSLPDGAVSTMNGTAEDAPVIAPTDRDEPETAGMDTSPAGETGASTITETEEPETSTVADTEAPAETQPADVPAATEEEAPVETNEEGVIENLEATRENDEIILSEGDDEEPASDSAEQAEETPATAPATDGTEPSAEAESATDTDAASDDAAAEGVAMDDASDDTEADTTALDNATVQETDSGETEAETTVDGDAAVEAETDDQVEADTANTSDATPAPEAAAEGTSEPEASSDTTPAPEATLGEATEEPAEPESDITAAEDDVDAAEAEVPELTVETSDSDAVTTTPMEDEALTVDGFNLTRAEELIDNSALSDEEKETLKSGLQDAQNTPELLEMMLEELRETLTEEEATPAVE